MITIDNLKAFGANVEAGVARCMNNEGFYLKLVQKILADTSFDRLKSEVEEEKYSEAFETAHALKGVTGNLELTPVFDMVCQITEILRGGFDPADKEELTSLVDGVTVKMNELRAMN